MENNSVADMIGESHFLAL